MKTIVFELHEDGTITFWDRNEPDSENITPIVEALQLQGVECVVESKHVSKVLWSITPDHDYCG